MKAVVVGPGLLGCGFVGPALRAAGYELTFIGRDRLKLANLDSRGGYRIRLVANGRSREFDVDGVHGVPARDQATATQAISEADLVVVAVGTSHVQAVAPLLAMGLSARRRPVNVLNFENVAGAGSRLRALVTEHVGADTVRGHGFAGALAHRAIARRLGDPRAGQPLTFVGDPPETFHVEGAGLGPPLPSIPGMTIASDYPAVVRGKLYVYSAGHATAAYLGALKGYRFVHTAIRDPEVRRASVGAMWEGRSALRAHYGEELGGEVGAILARFENAALDDPLCRVGRDPMRKLGPDDRLVGPARLAEQESIRAENLALAAAGALCFEGPRDPSAVLLRKQLVERGIWDTLAAVCGLDPGGPLALRIARAWRRLAPGMQPDNLLVSLERDVWDLDVGHLHACAGRARELPVPERRSARRSAVGLR